jgi:hypothetical protein
VQAKSYGIKQYLTNFFHNFGESAKAQAGLPTDQEVMESNAKIENLRAEAARNQALVQQMGQMVMLPNGTQMPYGVALKVAPELIKGQVKTDIAGQQNDTKLLGLGMRRNAQTGELEQIPQNELPPTVAANLRKSQADSLYKDAQTKYQQALLDFQSAPNQIKLKALQMQAQRVQALQSIAQSAVERTKADLYGTDLQGNALPGAPTDYDGNPIGLKTASNPNTQKGLKAWGEVGDSIARLEQMKRLKAEADSSPNPGAADMALLFNHMAMTGGNVSGMRMGEQITKDHMKARGIPEELGLLYNKTASGAQLSPEQRANFVALAEDQVKSKLAKGEVVGGMYGMNNAPRSVANAAKRAGINTPQTQSAITPAEARDYLQRAGGDKNLARDMARKDGKRF